VRTNAWIVTGGTHAGVMEHVGNIMHNLLKDKYVPVIGIATFGIVTDGGQLFETVSQPRQFGQSMCRL
jgi:hypothetical protein